MKSTARIFPELLAGAFSPVLFAAVLLAAVLFAAGCASCKVERRGASMVTVNNEGLFLFYLLPICTGHPESPQKVKWFENSLTVANNIKVLDAAAAESGAATYRNLATHPDEEVIFPLLFKRKILRTSAELVIPKK